MRIVIILIIILVAIMAIQAKILGGKSENCYQTAVALLPAEPRKAYEAMKPSFPTSNMLTLGKAARTQRNFFTSLRDRMIGRITSQHDLTVDWSGQLVECLGVFQSAMKEETLSEGIKQPLPEHVKMIFTALMEQRDKISESVGIGAWDSLVKSLERIESEGLVNDLVVPGASDFVRGLADVDRRGIAWREALTVAQGALDEGVMALGLAYSSGPKSPLATQLDKKIPDDSLLKAEDAFARGQAACLKFAKAFGHDGQRGAMPPELEAPWGKMHFNVAAIRLAHLMDAGPELSSAASYYLTKLYVHPGTDTMPTDGEIYGSFINTIGQQLMKSSDTFQKLDDLALGSEKAACLALVHWTMVGFSKTLGRTDQAEAAAGKYQSMRGSPMGTEPAQKLVSDLNAADFPFIFLR